MVVGFGWVPPADWPSPPAQRSGAPRGGECRRGNGGFSQRVQQFGGMTPSPLSTPLPAIAGGGSFLFCNDPSAGSPTETLLRLLLPLNDQVWPTSRLWVGVAPLPEPIRRPHWAIQSVVATGGGLVHSAGELLHSP